MGGRCAATFLRACVALLLAGEAFGNEDTSYGAVPPSVGGDDEAKVSRGTYIPPDGIPYVHADHAWQELQRFQKLNWNWGKTSNKIGFSQFRLSASYFQWAGFGAALVCFIILHYYFMDWPSTNPYHAILLPMWLGVALIYGAFVHSHLGRDAGVAWMTGYVFEFIFFIEKVFVFHIIATAFDLGRRLTQKALSMVVLLSILFQMVFYMGLAHYLRSFHVLPYLLGVWLVYAGVQSAMENDHAYINIKQTAMYRCLARGLGNRLYPEYVEDRFFHNTRGLSCVTMLFVVTVCLLAVNFLMQVDVTLAKIQSLENAYLNFTSSVVAVFAVPELFFVARDLFQRYLLLKHCVSFVLIFSGLEMLCQSFIGFPDLVERGVIVVVMLLCILASVTSRKSAAA